MYAAVGLEEASEVVCGLGETEQKAEADARERARQKGKDPHLIRVVPVGIEAARQIRGGEVDAGRLGL